MMDNHEIHSRYATSIINPVVAVPIHSPTPTADEELSLRQCGIVLASHPIRIVHPYGLDMAAYRKILPSAEHTPVPASWMMSIGAYNRMLINPNFFSIFESYSHLLIHEPDAFVLSDQLLYWCLAGFDYIGAPWFEGYSKPLQNARFHGVGNSGFSLFNIQSALRLLGSHYRWYPYKASMRNILHRLLLRPGSSGRSAVMAMGTAGQIRGAHKISPLHCDIFWSFFAPRADPSFLIPDPSKAVFFAWEAMPEICHEICGGSFPFGIHAWARYNRDFIENVVFPSLPVAPN